MSIPRQSLTVLLVDDEAYFRRFVGKVLKVEGIGTVIEAHNGHECVKQFQAHRPQLVVLDINMPLLDGVATLKEVRRLSADVPVVMLTSIAEEAVVEECVTEQASHFIRKDVRADQLQAELREMLNKFFPNEDKPHVHTPNTPG